MRQQGFVLIGQKIYLCHGSVGGGLSFATQKYIS